METNNVKILAVVDKGDRLGELAAAVSRAMPGAALAIAGNGPEGMELALARDPDVILLDTAATGMDGCALCRKIKAHKRLRAIPVVFLITAGTDLDTRGRALEAGAEGFLATPFDDAELTAQIRAMARIKAASPIRPRKKRRGAGSAAGHAGEQDDRLMAASKRIEELTAENERLKKAEVELRGREEKYRSIFNNAQVGIYRTRISDGKVIECNELFARTYGYETPEACAADFVVSKHYSDPGARKKLLDSLMESGKVNDAEARFVRKNGEEIWIRYSASVYPEEGYLEGVGHDITGEKRALEALREREARLSGIYSAAPVGIGVEVNRVIQDVNDAMCRITGYSRAELIGRNSRMLYLSDEDFESVGRDKYSQVAEHGSASTEARLKRKDGSVRDVLLSATPLDPADLSKGMIFTVLDTTRRRSTEKALRDSRELLLAVLNSIPVRVFWKDRNLVYLGCNMPFARDAGFEKPEDVIGKDDHAMWRREQAEMYRADDRAVLESGEAKVLFEESLITPLGERITLLTSKHPLRDAGGATVGVLGTYHDITESKRADEERDKLQAQLTQAQKMESVGRLAGGVAHDFNNSLQTILGYADLALGGLDKADPLYDDMVEIRNAAERSANLTRQLLAFARKQTILPRALDLNDTVTGMLQMLRRLIGEDIDLVWMPGAGLWAVKMDPSQVDQILANLVVNARDAITGVGNITIRTRNVEPDADYRDSHGEALHGHYVLISVSDDGCGMDPEVQAQLFEPFFTTKEVGKGTGLGLATVYGIVNQNNGFVEVGSEPGKGSIFRIYLPRYVAETEESPKTSASAAKLGGTETVLLVEDQKSVLKLGARLLATLGYTVLSAGTPGEAIRTAEEHGGEIHLLMTDVIMPGMNGRELAGRVRQIRPGIQCLYMSGYTADVIARQGMIEEGVQFIQKPFSGKEIAAKIRAALRGSQDCGR